MTRYPLLPPCLCFVLGMVVCFVMPAAFGMVAAVTVTGLLVLAILYLRVLLLRRRNNRLQPLPPVVIRQILLSVAVFLLFIFAGYCRMLMSWHDSHRAVGPPRQMITAVVMGSPSHYDGKTRFEAVALGGALRGEHIQVWLYDNKDTTAVQLWRHLSNGVALTMNARVRAVADTSSYSRYLMSHGIRAQCSTNSNTVFVTATDKAAIPFGARLKISAHHLRQRLLRHLGQKGLTGDDSGIVAAMLLGERSSLSEATISHFRHSGASHVLALSGLHLGIIYMLLQLVTLSRRKRLITETVTIAFIWFYVILVGMMPSVVRAASMITICSLFSMCGRRSISLNSLALVAMVMLMVNPLQIFDIGFQLSFVSVAFILVYAVPVIKVLCPFGCNKIWKWSASVVVISIVAQMATAPIVAHSFSIIPNYFLLTNIAVVPLSWLLLTLSLIMVAVSWIPVIGSWMTVASMSVAGSLDYILSFISGLPGAVTTIPRITPITVFCLYIIIIGLLEIMRSEMKRIDIRYGNML